MASLMLVLTSVVAQSPTPDTITIRRSSDNIADAIRITGFKLDGVSYDLTSSKNSQPIATLPGWLQRLQIVVQNRSSKKVIAGTIQVTCPGVSKDHPIDDPRIWDQFTLGIFPDRYFGRAIQDASSAGTPPLISVKPKDEMVFILQDDFSRMTKKIAQGPQFSECTVDPRNFFFDDGTMWSPRQFYKPDPNSDRGYVPITAQEFGMEVPAY